MFLGLSTGDILKPEMVKRMAAKPLILALANPKPEINPDDARHPGTYVDRMPANIRSVADNYNHLHEQPTIFYALMFFAALTGGADHVATYLAWAYVGLRVVHSFVQVLSPKVTLRFMMFALASLVLFILAGKEVVRILTLA